MKSKLISLTSILSSIKYFLSRNLHHLKAYSFFYLKKSNPNSVRVVIFAQGRTGSTLLEDLLSSTSYFKKRGEILGKEGTKIKFPYKYITGLANITDKENFIFHLKIYHLTRDRKKQINPSEFIKKLDNDGWKIIYLYRENKLNHVLSNLIAEERMKYHKYDNKKEHFHLSVDLTALKKNIGERIQFERAELETLANVEYLTINYEKDLKDADKHQKTINKILNYLNLEPRPCHTDHVKINQSTQKEVLQNFDEVKSFLMENKMSEYIE